MHPHRRPLGAALCLAVATFAASPVTVDARGRCEYTTAERQATARAMAAVRTAMPELLRKHEVPGASVALIADGHPRWTSGYGWAVREQRIPVSPDTLFQVGSMTVPVTAWTVLNLVQRRRIRLDEPVARFLRGRDLPDTPFDRSLVTPRRVLSHTAGLSIRAYGGFRPEETLQTLNQSLRGAVDAGNQPVAVVDEPGASFAYSAGGYALAELMVRQMDNEQFSNVATRQILRRLQMFRSDLPDRPEQGPPLANSYDDAGQPTPALSFSALGAVGLQTTAPDYAKLVSAMMSGPCEESPGRRALSADLVKQSQQPQPNSDNSLIFAGSSYGLGVALKTLASGRTLLYHPGDNPPNWHGIFAAIPERQSGIVLLTSAPGGRAMRVELVCRWLAALEEHPPAECSGEATGG
jgi:CubicO group peptidase (beta-lactamase class C family)